MSDRRARTLTTPKALIEAGLAAPGRGGMAAVAERYAIACRRRSPP